MKQHYNSFYSTCVRINFYLFIGLICSVYTFKFLYHPPTVYQANVADCFYGAGWEERILTYVSFNRNNNTYQLCHVDYGTNIHAAQSNASEADKHSKLFTNWRNKKINACTRGQAGGVCHRVRWKWKLPKYKINIWGGKKAWIQETHRAACYTPKQMWTLLSLIFLF